MMSIQTSAGMTTNPGHLSATERRNYVRRNRAGKSISQMASHLGVSYQTVYNDITALKNKNMLSATYKQFDDLTDKDIKFINREMKKKTPINEIAYALFTSLDVVHKAYTTMINNPSMMKPKADERPRNGFFTPEQMRSFIDLMKAGKRQEAADMFNVSLSTIDSYKRRFVKRLAAMSAETEVLTEKPLGVMTPVEKEDPASWAEEMEEADLDALIPTPEVKADEPLDEKLMDGSYDEVPEEETIAEVDQGDYTDEACCDEECCEGGYDTVVSTTGRDINVNVNITIDVQLSSATKSLLQGLLGL